MRLKLTYGKNSTVEEKASSRNGQSIDNSHVRQPEAKKPQTLIREGCTVLVGLPSGLISNQMK